MPTPKKGWELAPARLAQLRKNLKALGADDNALSGWHAEEKERQGGESAGFRDAEFVSPSNKRFRSQKAVERHLGLDSDAKPKPKAAPKVKATAKPPDETASKRARPSPLALVPCAPASESSLLAPLMADLSKFVSDNRDVLFDGTARVNTPTLRVGCGGKDTFSMVGTFKVGPSMNPGFLQHLGRPGFVRHTTMGNLVVRAVPPATDFADGKLTALQYMAYSRAAALISVVDPKWAAGDFVVQFAYMNDPSHHVKCHVDNDVSFQYGLALGDFSGAALRCYLDKEKTAYRDFEAPGRIVK